MSVDYYVRLLDHQDRIEGFRKGIEEAVGEGDRVLDLGTGLGTFAFFAVRAGAGLVRAVDRDPVIHVAHTLARINGLDDRIEFIRSRVQDVEIPDDLDVLVFEDFPNRLMNDRTFRILRRFEENLLARGGRMVPRRARLHLAPGRIGVAGVPPRSVRRAGSWAKLGRRYDLDWTPTRTYLANEPRSGFLKPEHLVGEPARGAALSLFPVPRAADLAVHGRWTLRSAGPVDALVLWFDLEPAEGVWLTNAPGPDAGPWGQILLPLDPPLEIEAGGALEAEVRRESFSDGAPGWMTWSARAEGKPEVRGHEFAAYPAALEDLYAGNGEEESERGGPSEGAADPPPRRR